MKNYLLAIATLTGTIVGVGIFALPYVISRSGVILLFVYMPILAVIQYFLHLHYAEIVLSTKGDHRLPGYVGRYFGPRGQRWSLVITLFSDYGVLITYIIIGGLFAHQLFSPIFGGSLLFYTTLVFLAESIIVLYGLKLISEVELALTATLIMIMGVIIFKSFGHFNLDNLAPVNWGNVFLPYGPVFFAVGGQAAIPEVCKLLAGAQHKIKSAIAWGTFLSAALITIFVLVVAGASGAGVSSDALAGMEAVLGDNVIKLALIFGILVVATSMISIAQACREVFWWDLGLNKNLAWALTCFLPFWLYLIGVQNLTKTVSLTGAVSGGILGIVVIVLLLAIKKKSDLKSAVICALNRPIAYALSALFILGFMYEVWNVFFNNI